MHDIGLQRIGHAGCSEERVVVPRLEGVNLQLGAGLLAADDEVRVAAGPRVRHRHHVVAPLDVGPVALAGAGELPGGDLAGLLALVGVLLPDVEPYFPAVVAVELVRLVLALELHPHPRRVLLRACRSGPESAPPHRGNGGGGGGGGGSRQGISGCRVGRRGISCPQGNSGGHCGGGGGGPSGHRGGGSGGGGPRGGPGRRGGRRDVPGGDGAVVPGGFRGSTPVVAAATPEAFRVAAAGAAADVDPDSFRDGTGAAAAAVSGDPDGGAAEAFRAGAGVIGGLGFGGAAASLPEAAGCGGGEAGAGAGAGVGGCSGGGGSAGELIAGGRGDGGGVGAGARRRSSV